MEISNQTEQFLKIVSGSGFDWLSEEIRYSLKSDPVPLMEDELLSSIRGSLGKEWRETDASVDSDQQSEASKIAPEEQLNVAIALLTLRLRQVSSYARASLQNLSSILTQKSSGEDITYQIQGFDPLQIEQIEALDQHIANLETALESWRGDTLED